MIYFIDDEDQLREELKDLIDDNPIEESEGEDSDGSNHHKKRKKSDDEDFDDRLEDEDYDLIEENLGVKLERKRFKRLRRIQDEESEEEQEKEADEERDAIANELFEGSGDEDERRSERSHRPEADTFEEGSDEGEYTDADDFIVDDDGRPIAEKRKKKKPIFSDAALQEAQDIFGVDFDYDEFGKYGEEDYEEEEEEEEDEYMDEDADTERPRRPKKQLKKKTTRKSIFEIYEPSELKRGHFTDMDNEIRNTDIPERMQLRSVPVTSVQEGSDELDLEAEWIYKQAFCKPTVSIQDAHLNAEAKERARKGPQTIGKIKKALDFMRNQHFEVPFISFYRKEYVLPELNINDLWKVYKFDAKWCQLSQRKENLLKLFDKMRNYQLDEIMKNPDAPLPDNVRVIKDDDIERLKNVQTSEELNDVYNHFMLYYSHEIQAMQESVRQKEKQARREERIQRRKQQIAEAEENGEDPPEEEEIPEEEEVDDTLKQAVRSGPYSICRKAGLDGLAKKFGLTPEHYAENLRDNYQRHEVDQEPTEPTTIATEYSSSRFKTAEEVLKAAQLMVAIQVAREPLVRKCVREMYMERAKMSVKPTKKGIKEIDENHPIYTMKYLKDKPVRDLVGVQFLNLMIAEEDKLITITLSDAIEGNTSNNYVDEMKQLYCRDEFSKLVQDWNALRVGSVEIALNRMVIPHLKKELSANLIAEAKECVMRSYILKINCLNNYISRTVQLQTEIIVHFTTNDFLDLRVLYQSSSAEKLFDVLTKETPETFYVGKLVLATVVGISHRKPQGDQLDQANPVRNEETGLWQCPFCLKNDFPELSEVWNHFDAGACPGKATGVRLRLDNGISGYIHIKNLSDRHVANPCERVGMGQIIHCRIIKIEVDRFSVECTSKSSDLADKNHEWRPQRDPFYDTESEQRDIKVEEDAKKAKQRQIYVKRVIVHPSFHNISFAETVKLMQTMKQGEAIVRPSSKGADHLTVTWKVTDDILQHIDVREEGKENAFSLGQSLWIGNEEFEDLDEIIARHVNPMAAYASELLDFKYYKPTVEGIKDKAEEILKEQKKENPNGIPYIISAAKTYPGKFLLSYLPRTRCRHEYVTVTSEGFRFRAQMFGRVSDLLRWFKEHFRDPVPGQSTPSTPRGAMTSRTPYTTTPGTVSGMNQEAIQRVAQNLPHHMLHSLSQVANQTPHHYPPHTPGAASTTGYGGGHTYPNTPYTPSGQTPFMTPYQTPHHSQPTPRYGQQTPSHHQGPFVHPPPPSMTPSHHRSAQSHRPTPPLSTPSGDPMDWKKVAEAWARLKSGPRVSGSTPRYEVSRKTPRSYDESSDRTTPSGRSRPSTRTPSYKSPRGTPHTNSSPRSMSLSGDGTPLYDES
ncbi:Transcription elongation factor SPT6 [Trachymyrmex cornetzi]|uniref:Transcription elongation factor SPT6 n=1 Tax=Trachymyrmex cornetzi TaxID=471704 RepID=A0A195D9S9_9HYME|nr:Transcription elongation factor SPT6 [Trachymyrmex cornetzi]